MYGHAFVGPLTGPGVEGIAFAIVKLRVPLVPQPFLAVTVTVPPLNPVRKVTITEVSFAPEPGLTTEVVVPSPGIVHTYPVAPVDLLMVYVAVLAVPINVHTLVGPVIGFGVPGDCVSK